jgi:DNA-binding GntR family transcriptional regulator
MHTISQHSLHDELLERLRKMIIGGNFLPGDKIPERQLCEQFGISRTPLREALKVLAAEGLVQLAPNRGAVVAALSSEEIDECEPISEAIEGLSGELACEKITDEEIREIKDLHERMSSEYRDGNLNAFLALNRQIHERIVAAARNDLLATIYDTVFFRIGWMRLLAQLSDEAHARIVSFHEEMMLALEARQGQRLSELLSTYLSYVFEAHRGDRARLRH